MAPSLKPVQHTASQGKGDEKADISYTCRGDDEKFSRVNRPCSDNVAIIREFDMSCSQIRTPWVGVTKPSGDVSAVTFFNLDHGAEGEGP